jgi:hypothetical protein
MLKIVLQWEPLHIMSVVVGVGRFRGPRLRATLKDPRYTQSSRSVLPGLGFISPYYCSIFTHKKNMVQILGSCDYTESYPRRRHYSNHTSVLFCVSTLEFAELQYLSSLLYTVRGLIVLESNM